MSNKRFTHATPPPELSSPLRTQLLLSLHRSTLEAVPFLGGAGGGRDPGMVADLAAHLQVQAFAPGAWPGGCSSVDMNCSDGAVGRDPGTVADLAAQLQVQAFAPGEAKT